MALRLYWYASSGFDDSSKFSIYACWRKQPAIWVSGRVRGNVRYDFTWVFGRHQGLEQSLEAVEDQVIPLLIADRMTS